MRRASPLRLGTVLFLSAISLATARCGGGRDGAGGQGGAPATSSVTGNASNGDTLTVSTSGTCKKCPESPLCDGQGLCPSTALLWDAFHACVCTTNCMKPCAIDASACGPSCIVSVECSQCMKNKCGFLLDACQNDL